MKLNAPTRRIPLLLLLAGTLLTGCRDVRSLFWRATHHRDSYYHHPARSVRPMGSAFRRPVPPAIPSKPGHRKRR